MWITIAIIGQIVIDTIEIATTHDLAVEIKQCHTCHFYFLFFSQRNFPEKIGQNFPQDLFPAKTIFKQKLRRRLFEGVEGWTVAPFGTEDWGSFSLGILDGHNIKFVLAQFIILKQIQVGHWMPGWQKLCDGTKGVRQKVLILFKNFTPYHTLFCRDIKICCDLRTFLKSLGNKVFFG